MNTSNTNPFNITKAVDFSDQEINDYWVDLHDKEGFVHLIKPTSQMPMILLGGKGSGKTHIMRYFSYSLQKIRHANNLISGIVNDKYLGVYLRCSGLNAPRFRGKGLEEDTWEAVFVYYMELWLSQLVLENVLDAFKKSNELKENQEQVCSAIVKLFDKYTAKRPRELIELLEHIHSLQRKLDYAVNNCAITRKLDIEICTTRGKLIFGIPKIFSDLLPSLQGCLFLYLIDEFENLSEAQQKYINTIIREKQSPASFKIGSRLYGVKTYDTYTEGETNKVDSEFAAIHLDDTLRKNKNYKDYAKRLIANRFAQCRHPITASETENAFCENLNKHFEDFSVTEFCLGETEFIYEKYIEKERPYFKSLKEKLKRGLELRILKGVESDKDIDSIINHLRCPDFPLLEKANVFLFYKNWYENKYSLLKASIDIEIQCAKYLETKSKKSKYHSILNHFKSDLLAQLLRECGRDQKYYGLDTFIEMSWGLPRNLLVLLKNIYAWAVFYGEEPFGNKPISIKAQNAGVLESANWFFSDAKISGKRGVEVRDSINRLGNFFRSIRYSDKPSECSCVSFSADISKAKHNAREIINDAKDYSLLIEVGQQVDKNTGEKYSRLQLNRMLTPRWDLSIYRRGTLVLNVGELNEIFSIDNDDSHLKKRIDGMNAPIFGKIIKPKDNKKIKSDTQIALPGLEDA